MVDKKKRPSRNEEAKAAKALQKKLKEDQKAKTLEIERLKNRTFIEVVNDKIANREKRYCKNQLVQDLDVLNKLYIAKEHYERREWAKKEEKE